MFRKEQKEQVSLPPEMRKLVPLLGLVPKTVMERQFKQIWKKKTKCLDNPEKNLKKIKALQSAQTKKIKYKGVTVHDCLEEVMTGKQTKAILVFIKWYKTEYYKISLKDLGIFK